MGDTSLQSLWYFLCCKTVVAMQKMMNCLINHIIYCQPCPVIVFIYQVSRIDHYIAQYAGWFKFRVHKISLARPPSFRGTNLLILVTYICSWHKLVKFLPFWRSNFLPKLSTYHKLKTRPISDNGTIGTTTLWEASNWALTAWIVSISEMIL